MKLLEQFKRILSIDSKNKFFIQETIEYDFVQFCVDSDENCSYSIYILLYPDNSTVEIQIRKQIIDFDLLGTLQKCNALSAHYCGLSFFVDNNFLFVRSVIEVHGDFYKAIPAIHKLYKVACKEFPYFTQNKLSKHNE